MGMLSHTDLRKGVKVDIDDHPYIITHSDFVKPGKGQAFTRVKIRSFLNGNTIDRTFKSNEKVKKAEVEERPCQYLYADADFYHFMDNSSYEQIAISIENLGDAKKWMEENMECRILSWNGRPLSVDPPNFVELEIAQCDPGVKGDTAQGGTKPATVSTGATVNVPLFVNEGEWIKIDTRTGDYMGAGQQIDVDLLRNRAALLRSIRKFFESRGSMEVETPALVVSPGLDAHIDAIEAEDWRLTTSPEFHMKRLLAAGSGPIHQIAKAWRARERGHGTSPSSPS